MMGRYSRGFMELDGIGWGDASRREVEQGDGEVLGGLLTSMVLEGHRGER